MLYGVRLSEVAKWPAWELDLLEHYLARDPSPTEKLEVAIARLTAIYVNAHQKEGTPAKRVTDFLPYLTTWPEPEGGRYSELDRQVLQELM